MSIFNISLLLVVFVVSLILTGILRRYALWKSMIDIPNERSSHSAPTPRGGGLAIVLTMLPVLSLLFFLETLSLNVFIGLLGASIIVSGIGFLDDHGHVAARWRLCAHICAASWGVFWLGSIIKITILNTEIHLGYVGTFLTVLYLVWLINLYNFMDGIDGIASIEAVTVNIGMLFFTLIISPNNDLWFLFLLFSAAVFGFLIWNFPPAKIFMGDACSGFIGLILGLFSVLSHQLDERLFWAWLIMLGVFNIDATVTLIRRIIRGEKFYEAHRSHAYQHLSRKIGLHKPVTIMVALINTLWLMPVATGVVLNWYAGLYGLLIAYIPLIGLAFFLKAGVKKNDHIFS